MKTVGLNIKCGGCAKTITKALNYLRLENILVDPESSFVEMDSPKEAESSNSILW